MAETHTTDQPQAQGQDFSVEESRAKRTERLQSKYRNRGGVFKPATHNALLDILLSRGVDGESPSKRRKSRKSIVPIRKESESPVKRRKSLKGRDEEQQEEQEVGASAKGKGKATARRKSVAPKKKSIAPKAKVVEEVSEDGQAVAGPSRARKATTRSTKRKKNDAVPEEEEPTKKAPNRPPPKKSSKKAQEREETVVDSAPPPKRTTGKRARSQPDPAEQDSDEEPIVQPKRTKTAHTNKQLLETIPEESESEDIPLRLVVRSRANARDTEKGPTLKAKRARSKARSGLPPKRPTARPPDFDEGEDDAGEDARPPGATVASRPAPILTTTNAGISQSSADKDAPRPLKRSNAKGKVAMPDADPEDVQARNIELLARVLNTSRRKVPALPESLVESESDDEPPPPKIKKRVQVNATRSKNADDPNAKEPTTTSSARSGASSTRGREEQAVTAQLAEHEPELDDQTEDPVDNEEMMAPKVKRPGKRAAKAVEEAQDTSSGASRKRGRSKQAAAPPTEGLDEPLQDPDEPPAPPRKRAKQTAASNVGGPVDAPAEDLRESDDIQEKLTAKPRSKPASRTRKAPARKPNTLKENLPAASRTSHQKKAVPMYKPKPKPRMSMFPPPVLVADSDDDPIDFLS